MIKSLLDRRIGILCGLMVILMGLLNPGFAQTPKRGGTLTVANDAPAVGLDPHLTTSASTYNHVEFVYDSLLRYNYKMESEPCLATSYDHPNTLTYIFHLRKGVKFHNGKEMTSEDVKFSFDRIMDPSTGATRDVLFDLIKTVEAPDKYTIKVTLSQQMPGFISLVSTMRYLAIVPKSEVLSQGTLQKVAIGTGPFKLKEYRHGVSATFVRNEDYWEPGLPYLDGFEFIIVKDEATRLAGFRKGTTEIGWVESAEIVKMASREPHLKVFPGSMGSQGRFWVNHRIFPFNNLKLRQAVSCSIDRQAIIDKVLLGQGEVSTMIPPAAAPYAVPKEEVMNLPYMKQDYNLAKKLLKEAGYPDGFEFTIKTSPRKSDYVGSAQMIQEQLSKVGIKANIELLEWGAFQNIVKRKRDFQAQIRSGDMRDDPSFYFYEYLYGKDNEVGQDDPEVNRLMQLCFAEENREKRIKYFRELQYKTAEQVTAMFTYAAPAHYEVVSDKVKGYHFIPCHSRLYLRETWIDR